MDFELERLIVFPARDLDVALVLDLFFNACAEALRGLDTLAFCLAIGATTLRGEVCANASLAAGSTSASDRQATMR
ncbi:MAG: hypothetical protein IPL72_15335 [Sulfuritalea sp.]|nr:hypothetical protein [Sulfuritalea sp.]